MSDENDGYPYVNGTWWQAPNLIIGRIQWLKDDLYCIISNDQPASHGGTCAIAISDPDGSGRIFYSARELPERLRLWRLGL